MSQDTNEKYISDLVGMELSELKKLSDEYVGDNPELEKLRFYFNLLGENVGVLKQLLKLPKLGENKEFDIKSTQLGSELGMKALKEAVCPIDLEELAGIVANQIVEELCKEFYGDDIFRKANSDCN